MGQIKKSTLTCWLTGYYGQFQAIASDGQSIVDVTPIPGDPGPGVRVNTKAEVVQLAERRWGKGVTWVGRGRVTLPKRGKRT